MVRIFKDQSGEFLVQTTCLDVDAFISDLAEALSETLSSAKEGGDLIALGVLTNAMPIAFKLSGYKAETVSEQRTLVCGRASPAESDLVATGGR
jgi:hypothetical protein